MDESSLDFSGEFLEPNSFLNLRVITEKGIVAWLHKVTDEEHKDINKNPDEENYTAVCHKIYLQLVGCF